MCELSARTSGRLRRWLDRTCFALAAVGVVIFGFVQGRITVTLPVLVLGVGPVSVLNATVACLSFAATVVASAGVFFIEILREHRRGSYPSEIEGAHTLRDWWRQRKR